MSQRGAEILKEALSLSPPERAELAEQILSTLELSPHQEIDQLWAQEAENRLDAFHQGKIPIVSAKEVFRKISPRKV